MGNRKVELKGYAVYSHALDEDITDKQVVVIDVLRATSVMITALANGSTKVVPAAEIEDAMHLYQKMPKDSTLLGGERDMNVIGGFDLGNSPLEYTKEKVGGKMTILATTNGTRAIQRAKRAQTLYIGAMINGTAVAQKIAESKQDTTILCAGTNEKYSLDDILTMGYIISRARKLMPGQKLKMDDLCRASLFLYDSKKLHLMEALKDSKHYRALMAAGYHADIEYCMQKDIFDLVPFFSEGEVRI